MSTPRKSPCPSINSPASPPRHRHEPFSAALPDPFQILGLRLKPLSLGRYRLLRRLDNGFVADESRKLEIADLIIAVVLCAHRVDEFLEILQRGDLQGVIKSWSRKICPVPVVAIIPFIGGWWRRRYAFNLLEKVALFRNYIEHHTRMPKYWDLTEDHAASGTHWSQGCEIVLRSNLGWTAEEINEAPLSKALADYIGFAESQNSVRLMTEQEIEMIAMLEKSDATAARN